MGIRRLTTRMLHKGENVSFGRPVVDPTDEDVVRTTSHRTKKAAIIDGPGLAHHVFYLHQRESGEGASDSDQIYSAITRRTLVWFQDLENAGFEVCHVYFDGVLPDSKTPVRIARLENYARQVVSFRSRFNEDAKWSTKVPISFQTRLESARHTSQLPPSAFLVAAVLEGLLQSSYAEVTEVVSGEADLYCSSAASKWSEKLGVAAYIFTNDSDLLVLDSGLDTKIVMLELMQHNTARNVPSISATVFTPSMIARAAGIPNMMAVAFLMDEDPHLTFEAAVVASSKKQEFVSSTSYLDFLSNFTPLQDSHASLAPQATLLLQRMHPRISEIAHQVLPGVSDFGDTTLRIFLPFLFDDPSRASAWHCSSSIRDLAYSVVLSCKARTNKVLEYDRKGAKLFPSTRRIGHSDLKDKLKAYVSWFEEQFMALATATPVQKWRVIATVIVIDALRGQGKQLPTQPDAAHTLRMQTPATWTQVHLKAQVEAALYSLRMVQQLGEFHLSFCGHQRGRCCVSRKLQQLQAMLGTLPSIAELHESSEDSRDMWEVLVSDYIDLEDETESCGSQSQTMESCDANARTVEVDSDMLKSNPYGLLTS